MLTNKFIITLYKSFLLAWMFLFVRSSCWMKLEYPW